MNLMISPRMVLLVAVSTMCAGGAAHANGDQPGNPMPSSPSPANCDQSGNPVPGVSLDRGSNCPPVFTAGVGWELTIRYGGIIDPALGDPTLVAGPAGKLAWRFTSLFGAWLRAGIDAGGRKGDSYVAVPVGIGVETFAQALLGSSLDANAGIGVVGQPIATCGTTTVASCDATIGGIVSLRLIPALTAATRPRGNFRLTTGIDLSVMYAPSARAAVVEPLFVIGAIYY